MISRHFNLLILVTHINELHLQKWILIVQCKVVFSSALQARQFELHQYVFMRISGKCASKDLQRFIKDSFCFSSRTPNRASAPRFSVSLRCINKIFLILLAWCLTQRIPYRALSKKTALNYFTQSYIVDVIFFQETVGRKKGSTRSPSLYRVCQGDSVFLFLFFFCCPLTYLTVSIFICLTFVS